MPARLIGLARGDRRLQLVRAVLRVERPERPFVRAAGLGRVEVVRYAPAGMFERQAPGLGVDAGLLPLRGVVAQRAVVDGRDAWRAHDGHIGHGDAGAEREDRRGEERSLQRAKHAGYLVWPAMRASRFRVTA